VGNFQQHAPSRAQLKTLAQLINQLRVEFNIPAENVLGHRTVKDTACPGGSFPWRTLYAMMGLPGPHHLFKRPPGQTLSRCPWCQEKSAASGEAFHVQPASAPP
jgi:hypothetical protein